MSEAKWASPEEYKRQKEERHQEYIQQARLKAIKQAHNKVFMSQEKHKRREAARKQALKDIEDSQSDYDPFSENTLANLTERYARKMLEHRKEQDRISWRAIWAVVIALGAHAYLLYLLFF